MMYNDLSRCELYNIVLGYETNQFRVKNRINSVLVGYICCFSYLQIASTGFNILHLVCGSPNSLCQLPVVMIMK